MKPFLHISRLFLDSFSFGEASTVSTQQSLFWSSYFLRVAAFLKSSVSERFISLNELFFAKHLPNSLFLRIGSSLGRYCFSIFYFSHFPHFLFFLETYLFRAATSSKDTTSYSSYLFRTIFSQHTFSEELLFHS